MKTIKNIIDILLGLSVLYSIFSFGWRILNTQLCSYNLPKNATCEQIAENHANNCKYLILRWKKVDYNKELQQCKAWEQKQEK